MLSYEKPLHYLKPFPEAELTLIQRFDWFSQLGHVDELVGARFVADREQAIQMATSDEWSDFLLEIRNGLTSFLNHRHSQHFGEWNNSTKALKAWYHSEVEPIVHDRMDSLGLPLELRDVVAWDLVTALQEAAFSQFRIPRSYDRLLMVYASGHLPCGADPLDPDSADPKATILFH